MPAPVPAVVDFSGLRILPLGDSMTAGNEADPSSYRSYRGPLYRMLQAAGHDVDFVGTLSQTPALGGDPNHNGYGGAQIGPGGSSNNLADRVRVILSSVLSLSKDACRRTQRDPYPTFTPGGGTLSAGTKKSGIRGLVGSTRYWSKSRTPSP